MQKESGRPSHDINISRELGLTPDQSEQLEIAKYLENAGLKTARFQAVADEIDLRVASHNVSINSFEEVHSKEVLDMIRMGNIEETIRKRINSEIGYDRENELADTLLNNLWDSRWNYHTTKVIDTKGMHRGAYASEQREERSRFVYTVY